MPPVCYWLSAFRCSPAPAPHVSLLPLLVRSVMRGSQCLVYVPCGPASHCTLFSFASVCVQACRSFLRAARPPPVHPYFVLDPLGILFFLDLYCFFHCYHLQFTAVFLPSASSSSFSHFPGWDSHCLSGFIGLLFQTLPLRSPSFFGRWITSNVFSPCHSLRATSILLGPHALSPFTPLPCPLCTAPLFHFSCSICTFFYPPCLGLHSPALPSVSWLRLPLVSLQPVFPSLTLRFFPYPFPTRLASTFRPISLHFVSPSRPLLTTYL